MHHDLIHSMLCHTFFFLLWYMAYTYRYLSS